MKGKTNMSITLAQTIGTKLKNMIDQLDEVYDLDQKKVVGPMKEMVDLILKACGEQPAPEPEPIEDKEDDDNRLPAGYANKVNTLRKKYGDDWQDKMTKHEKMELIEEVRKSM
jgi:hypothetical protein